MKKLVCVLLCVLMTAPFCVGAAEMEIPETGAQAYVLYCPDTGAVLAASHEHRRMKPASTTKLMTTLLTLERAAKGNETVTFSQEMVAEGSSMYLKLGERVTLRDLAVGMMLSSGNDAANAAALSIGGSIERFAAMMNDRAAAIGMKDTHFVTPSGLDDDDHYSSAYDLALLMAQGLRSEDFARLTAQKSGEVKFIEPDNKRVTYRNHNRLLSLYPDCIGGKTGYTQAAGRCLVSAARRDGLTLICVTLNDRSDWNDHMALYDYGFSRVKTVRSPDTAFCPDVPLAGGEMPSVAVRGETDFSAPVTAQTEVQRRVLLPNFLYAPLSEGDVVGCIEYRVGSTVIGTVNLIAATDAPEAKRRGFFEYIKELFFHG
ncbi:MAG: D-alanyl-D-alanine carboxypeptidase [Ruminococcus sp.]|nr:D-alanyl-D-alanine carboxypeptidase [Ruminococcus sp.]